MESIILMGIKHCGKSTQGKLLSKKLSCNFYDTDDEIKTLTGKTPREIYTESGKEGFIEAELNSCKNLVDNLIKKNECAVIATGGGICNNEKAVEHLKKVGKLVFLNVDEETACSRITREITFSKSRKMENLPAYIAKENPRTMNDVRKIFHNFYVERQEIYKKLCDIEVNFKKNATKQENLNQLLLKL